MHMYNTNDLQLDLKSYNHLPDSLVFFSHARSNFNFIIDNFILYLISDLPLVYFGHYFVPYFVFISYYISRSEFK